MHSKAEPSSDRSLKTDPATLIERLLGSSGEDAERERRFRIGDLADRFGVTARTLRFYEQRGLLTPERRGTVRYFTQADYRRLQIIQFCKRFGFSLQEAERIITDYLSEAAAPEKLAEFFALLQQQQTAMREQRDDLARSITALDAAIAVLKRM